MSDERSEYRQPPDSGGLVPPGWFVMDHELRPDPTLKGYIERNDSVFGQCVGKDCQRKASMDLRELLRLTGPTLHLRKIAQYMRCTRLEGCRFTFSRLEPRINIPLGRFAGQRHVRLRLRCQSCLGFTHRKVEPVIAWLESTGQGGAHTWIHDLQQMLKARCGCGRADWKIEVVIFDLADRRWQEQGEAVFVDRPGRATGRPSSRSAG